jgi:hypothetical protein
MQTDDLVNAVLELDAENDLLRVGQAVNERVQQLRDEFRSSLRERLQVGQRVAINSRIRPKYLGGLTGSIAAPPEQDRVSVQLDHPARARNYASDAGIAQIGLGAIDVLPDHEGADSAPPAQPER